MAQNPQKMMRQMQKLQEDMRRVQEQLAEETVSASAGGGAVTVTVSGSLEVTAVKIDPAAIDPEGLDLLEDTVVAAVNEAMRKAQELANQRLGAVAGALGSMGIPGL